MIVKEFFEIRPDGVELERTYSDGNFKIQSEDNGAIYDEAIDLKELNRQYEETDIPIDEETDIPIEINYSINQN